MKFLNKETKTIIETNDKDRITKFKGYPDKFEEVKEEKVKELTVPEIKSKLKELNIEFDDKAKKEDLLVLLPKE